MNTTDKLITRTEAAARLGVSMRTLDRYIRDGRLVAHKYSTTRRPLTGAVRVSEASLTAYLDAVKVTTEGNGGDDGAPGRDGTREGS